jgi:hypothetical protein
MQLGMVSFPPLSRSVVQVQYARAVRDPPLVVVTLAISGFARPGYPIVIGALFANEELPE